ncbi:MAG: endonuclease/exonuclease/phosphatase family protein [Oscillospiraceae bacterium]|jgi:endonuclease/exonuclease/phosphatase family metal-dependent hydrolase|nr:endonuclease/exonuclease/phosphatase family protein [Oscillospiraceae bacterium]
MGIPTKHYSGKRSPFPAIARTLAAVIGVAVLLLTCLALFAVITDYRPDETSRLTVNGVSGAQTVRRETAYRLLTFDIGFCGLDAARDYYPDGGQQSLADSADAAADNLAAVEKALQSAGADFVFLQEVDVTSRRARKLDQRTALESLLPGLVSSFALDFQVPFLPLPLSSPTGRVESGLLTLSGVAVRESARHSFTAERSFPQRLIDRDCCFLALRVAVEGGGELLLVNVHLTDDDTLRAAHLAQLSEFLQAEAQAGRYIIVGGNWNALLPDTGTAGATAAALSWDLPLPTDFVPPGFHWAADTERFTRRAGDQPYTEGLSFTASTDGFLLSDNVEALSVKTTDLRFAHAAHNPALLRFSLR